MLEYSGEVLSFLLRRLRQILRSRSTPGAPRLCMNVQRPLQQHRYRGIVNLTALETQAIIQLIQQDRSKRKLQEQ